MHIPLPIIPHNRPRPLPILVVPLDVDAKAPVHLEAQQDLVVDDVPPLRGLVPLHPLQIELLQPGRQVGRLLGEALRLHLGIARCLCGPELARVEGCDLGGVARRGVRGRELGVLRGERVELAGELLEAGFYLAHAEVARLLERGEGFADARDGELVGLDVEVVDCVVDELLWNSRQVFWPFF